MIGKNFIDGVTSFVVVLITASIIFAQPGGGPPPPPPAPIFDILDWDITKDPGTPPHLDGYIEFTGTPNRNYRAVLVAKCVSAETDPTYTVIAVSTAATDNAGYATVDLRGTLPVATQGWYCRLLLVAVDDDLDDEWWSPDVWISVV